MSSRGVLERPAARPRRSAKSSIGETVGKKGHRRRRPSPRASPLSCPPPLRRVFCDGLLRRSWSSRGGDGRTSRESVAFALRAGLRRASDGTVPSLAAGSRLIPARPRMSEKKRNVSARPSLLAPRTRFVFGVVFFSEPRLPSERSPLRARSVGFLLVSSFPFVVVRVPNPVHC